MAPYSTRKCYCLNSCESVPSALCFCWPGYHEQEALHRTAERVLGLGLLQQAVTSAWTSASRLHLHTRLSSVNSVLAQSFESYLVRRYKCGDTCMQAQILKELTSQSRTAQRESPAGALATCCLRNFIHVCQNRRWVYYYFFSREDSIHHGACFE